VLPYHRNFYKAGVKGSFLSRKTIEYLAAGKPIIVSDIAGKDSCLKEKENMLAYQPGHPEDLARKIQQLLTDSSLYRRISQSNLRLAEEFSWERVVLNSNIINYLNENR
jgi:glycosyltransferase involved in cell wall biosynthesis